jgi:hypothetical protein
MFTLIKREVRDHLGFFISAMIFSGILVGLSISLLYEYPHVDRVVARMGVWIIAVSIVILGFFAMGAVQMYVDRTRKISAFISTLPVSRSRILLAKLIAGILAILTLLLPLVITAIILLRLLSPPIPLYAGIIFEGFTGIFLTAFACYCIGLQIGGNSGKPGTALGGLALTFILISLIFIKGFGAPIVLILVPFIIASLVRIWHTFTTTSL